MINIREVRKSMELLNKLNEMSLQTVFDDFCEYSNQKIPQEICDKFRMRGMSNEDFLQSDFLIRNGFKNILTCTNKEKVEAKYYIVKYCNNGGDDGADPQVLIFDDEKIRDAFFSELVTILKTQERLLIIEDKEYEFTYEYSDSEDWTYSYTKDFIDDTQRTNVKSFFVNDTGQLVLQTDAGKDVFFFT